LTEHAGRAETLEKIREGGWDFVILQENLMLGVLSQDEYLESAHVLDRIVRESGGQTVLLMLWGSKYDARVTTSEQARVSREIGDALNVQVVPLGPAWRLVRQTDPEMRLYESGSDAAGLHGSYLNAAVLLAALINVDPAESDFLPLDADGRPLIAEEDAPLLRRVAWEAVMGRNAEP
jgi:hypothetical protein